MKKRNMLTCLIVLAVMLVTTESYQNLTPVDNDHLVSHFNDKEPDPK
ncbi:hypothetical protein Pryu01_01861 [Paraliobacillus ryukyuensis]|uniref:Uncharacterized protein n=1 Tax=Paraliobacillus ryukyuensis TaxID=200904 RepID=A0A366DSW0_9BACI|nr:hypothetical protein [Paraliobacillus ryukyuensis]RBO93173.1 hypothetical protein DES48_11339 [Paraliobacillus ryukyuensis]